MSTKRKVYTEATRPTPKGFKTSLPSLTKQSEAEACDINNIVRRYAGTGALPSTNRAAFFADVSEMGDYREALDRIREAQNAFMELPSDLRKRFKDDPAEFLDFCADPDNREEMVELGLIENVSDVVNLPEALRVKEEDSSSTEDSTQSE